MNKTYRLFISHSWAYKDAYTKIINFFDTKNLDYYNHSVPINDPIHTNGSDKELRTAIDSKIKGTSCIVILAGVYASYSKWIKTEIEIAVSYGKPILAVEPWASRHTSQIVKIAATKIVKWQSKSVVDGIKEIAL